MASKAATALALLVLGAVLFTVGQAAAGWQQERASVRPVSLSSVTVGTVSCNDQTAHTFQANAVSAEMWNTNTSRDVCIAWSGTPDYTDVTTCDVVLGAYAGSGSSQVYQTPPTLSLSGLAIKCDANGATVIRVSEFVGPTP